MEIAQDGFHCDGALWVSGAARAGQSVLGGKKWVAQRGTLWVVR